MMKLKAHLLTQGMHGMVSQVEGLSKALNLSFRHHTIKLKPFWDFIPPRFSPISENLVKFDHKKISQVILDQANILDGNILSNPTAYMESLTDLFIK